ncbi:MAG: alpha/beta fold hydrolase [Pseudomonadota bacterium]|nr:alpha/beta fold hydrolase [Pseudomonadota bacterium]
MSRRARYYLGEAFVVEHGPASGAVRGTAILILPPMGYEDTCAYRPLRVLADALARAGHVVMRIDWPGLGDSARDDGDPALVDRCREAVAAAAASLRARGFTRVAAVGVRAGGLIALASDALDELVLWATPPRGKGYLREERAFHKMAAHAYGDPPAGRPPLPEGAVEAGGFVYNPRTVAALEGLVAAELAAQLATTRRVRRVLLIERDGTAPLSAFTDALAGAGAEVSVSSASGLGSLLENPYEAALDPSVEAAVLGWFSLGAGVIVPLTTARKDTIVLDSGVRERPWVHRGGAGELSGIVCEPAGGAPAGAAWTLFFNAGGIRRAGPCRLWTTAARSLAAAGHPSLRFDVRGVGDSDGSSIPHRDLEEMYSESSIEDALAAYDALRARGAGAIDVVGLCSGAFLGVQVAVRRPVRRALLFNGLAFVWNDDARASGVTAHIRGSLLNARRWRRLLTGRIDAVALARAVVSKSRITLGEAASRLRGEPPPDEVAALLRAVARSGTDLHLVSSEGDPSIAYLERHLPPRQRPRLTVLPGVDHTIRPIWAHAGVVQLIRESAS